jgi:hypothetical protein
MDRNTVLQAMRRLQERGEPVSARAVRREVGHGSHRDIAHHLRAIEATPLEPPGPTPVAPPALPAPPTPAPAPRAPAGDPMTAGMAVLRQREAAATARELADRAAYVQKMGAAMAAYLAPRPCPPVATITVGDPLQPVEGQLHTLVQQQHLTPADAALVLRVIAEQRPALAEADLDVPLADTRTVRVSRYDSPPDPHPGG